MAQPVEVDVGAARDGDEPLAAPAGPRHVLLDARHRERAGRLRDRTRIFEQVLDRGAGFVGVDEHDLVDVLAHETEGFLADASHRHAVGKHADAIERDAPARAQRFVHRRRVSRLDADHLDARIEVLHVGRDARDQPAAADRHEYRVEFATGLPQDLDRNRARPADHVRVVEQVLNTSSRSRAAQRVLVGVVVTLQHRFAAEIDDGLHLDLRGRHRHHDHRLDAASLRRERHALRVIAGEAQITPRPAADCDRFAIRL